MDSMGEEDEGKDENIVDVTNEQLPSLDSVDISESTQQIDLTGNRLSILDEKLRIPAEPRWLSLQKNLIKDISTISSFGSFRHLGTLILRDNLIEELPQDLSSLAKLKIVDFSYNELRDMSAVATLPKDLEELYLTKNKIRSIQGLQGFKSLRILELGSNRLRVMENLEDLVSLKELWLASNKISEIHCLERLKELVILSLQSNRLVSMAGVGRKHKLRELYVSQNGIRVATELDNFPELQTLDIGYNELEELPAVPVDVRLEELWLNNNRIGSLDALESSLAGQKSSLNTIYLEENPCANDKDYVSKIRSFFGKIEQIDANVL